MKNPFNASATSGKSAYAPCYSARGRLRLLAVTVFCLIGVGTVLHHTFFPWLHAIRPCDTVFGLPGINIIIFTPFAGLPLLLLLASLVTLPENAAYFPQRSIPFARAQDAAPDPLAL